MKVTGDLRKGGEFEFSVKTSAAANSTFTAITADEVIVSRRFDAIADLPPNTKVIAHWHGQYRTDAFISTVGTLRRKAAEQGFLTHATPKKVLVERSVWMAEKEALFTELWNAGAKLPSIRRACGITVEGVETFRKRLGLEPRE